MYYLIKKYWTSTPMLNPVTILKNCLQNNYKLKLTALQGAVSKNKNNISENK